MLKKIELNGVDGAPIKIGKPCKLTLTFEGARNEVYETLTRRGYSNLQKKDENPDAKIKVNVSYDVPTLSQELKDTIEQLGNLEGAEATHTDQHGREMKILSTAALMAQLGINIK